MSATTALPESSTLESESFVDRRSPRPGIVAPARERRQFTNSHTELSPDAAELARAVDQYKVRHRRRFVTFEEVLTVLKSLCYSR